jgi:uncharacterized membrane protein
MATAIVTATPTDLATTKARISSIDIIRGIVMVIMALDHARDFFHLGAVAYNPTDMNTTTPALFFTRWITHFCAPTFVFLAGTSIYINAQRKTKKDLTYFLISRGLWLILLELVVVRFGLFFNLYFDVIMLQVIWVIGASMIVMSLLIHFNYYAVLVVGLLVTFGHNATDMIQLKQGDALFPLWAVVHQAGFVIISPDRAIMAFYPLLPWLGIMILGYCMGKVFEKNFDSGKRQRVLLITGAISILLFIIIRFTNVYGDPAPWATQKDSLYTFMSFLNTTKYPPSLLYTLMTIGPMLILLACMEKINLRVLQPFVVFGRVPLFFYILHFYLIHITALLLFMNKTGVSLSAIDFHFNKSFGGITPEGGYSLPWVYVGWMAVVLFLYPICKWYNKYKSTHSDWWLSYL